MSAANPQEFIHWNQNLKILFKTKAVLLRLLNSSCLYDLKQETSMKSLILIFSIVWQIYFQEKEYFQNSKCY